MLKITCEINDYSDSEMNIIKIHNHGRGSNIIEMEIDGNLYMVDGKELRTAINKCLNIRV